MSKKIKYVMSMSEQLNIEVKFGKAWGHNCPLGVLMTQHCIFWYIKSVTPAEIRKIAFNVRFGIKSLHPKKIPHTFLF
jgi:carbohydrate-binding DOMON domain-containing protein